MGYSFTDLGAEGCRRSLNALFFQPCLRRASEWVIPGKFFKDAHDLFSTKSEKCTGVHDFRKILGSPGSALGVHDFSTKSEKCVGVRDLGEILEVFGARWECVISSTKSEKYVGSAWFQENAWSPSSALEVHSALLLRWWECVKVRWSALPMTGVREKCALQRTSVQRGDLCFPWLTSGKWQKLDFF